MRKPIILIDSDEVCFPFGEVILEILKNIFPDLTIPILKRWYLEDNFSCIKIKKEINRIFSQKGFFAKEMIVDGAREAIDSMTKIGYEVYVCTSPMIQNAWSMEDKVTWWTRYFGYEFAAKRLIICPDKTMIYGDILIDDNPNIICGNHTPTWEQIVFDRPYNKHLEKLRRLDWANYDYLDVIYKALYKQQTKKLEKELSDCKITI